MNYQLVGGQAHWYPKVRLWVTTKNRQPPRHAHPRLAVTITESSATETTQASSVPDVASYRLYYTSPDGTTFVSAPAAQKSHTAASP